METVSRTIRRKPKTENYNIELCQNICQQWKLYQEQSAENQKPKTTTSNCVKIFANNGNCIKNNPQKTKNRKLQHRSVSKYLPTMGTVSRTIRRKPKTENYNIEV